MNHLTAYRDVTETDISPLISAINIMGKNLTGLELGVFRAESFLTILHNCNNVKKLIGVDNWKPYEDYLRRVPNGVPVSITDEKQMKLNESIAMLNLEYGTPKGKKVVIIKKDSLDAIKHINDKSLDFIFFDAMMTEKQCLEEAMAYYPKIKKGGYFTGHDSICIQQVIEPIKKVKKHFKNNNDLITYANCFLFKI